MPDADPQVQIGFGSALVITAMAFVYAVYGIVSDQARPIVLGLLGTVAFALFASFLSFQQQRRERR